MVLPAGLSPATTTFEASHSDTLSYGSIEIGGSPRCCPVLCGLRDRCIAAMLATPTRHEGGSRSAGRRGQACEVLTDTGISHPFKMDRTTGNAPAYSCSRSKR